jgi:bifunctional non-homologous end joining protein LigD
MAVQTLEQYWAKRDFKKTHEPSGKTPRPKSKTAGGIFVIHKHAATRLHYDLRLEHDGVLWSWAVTRGPSLDPAEKRLAVHVEDHPYDYAGFEGEIPKGEYGAGAVIVWDEGAWAPKHDPAAMMKKGHIEFELKGSKLNGDWHLVRLKPRPKEKRDNWLLIKSDDASARPGEDILEDAPQSVKSGLTIEDIEAGRDAPLHAKGPSSGTKGKAKANGRAKSEVAASAMPGFIEPCLATLQATPPSGAEWLHEVKFDGYRIQAHLHGGKVKLLTRSGLDWTQKFGDEMRDAVASLPAKQAILDGEIVAMSDAGVSSFSALQTALSTGKTDRLIGYFFDLLYLDGSDLTGEPLAERKAKLERLLKGGEAGPLRYSEHFVEPGQTMLKHACRMGLEGVVSKRADAPYRGGRGHDWRKSKCTQRQEFVIAGYLPSEKTGRGLRSLIMAFYEDGKLRPAGNVGTGFNALTSTDLKKKLDRLKAPKPPFTGPLAKQKGAVWVKPELVAEIEFRAWTADKILRHASFQGLREDKPAEEVVAEVPEKAETSRPKAAGKKVGSTRKAGPMTEVKLTSPDKKLWPAVGVTKKDLLDYYGQAWPRMERFVVKRPLSLVRAPDGVGGQRFFQKHASPGMSDAILRMKDPDTGDELLYIEDFDGLAALVQYGCVEVHIWGSTIDKIEQPDQIVFDLDPDEGLGVQAVRDAALDVRSRLDEVGLPSFLKTSGGKGFHVIVPLKPSADWTGVKTFAHDFARAMEQSAPERYTATLSKKARTGRIFIDYLRNGRGSTTVAPWSSRAKEKATVSVPVPWEALEKKLAPDAFTIGNKALAEALKGDDAWASFDGARKTLKS